MDRILELQAKYKRIYKKYLGILLLALFLWAGVAGCIIVLFTTNVIKITGAVFLSGTVTAVVGVFSLAFCTLKLLPAYRTFKVYRDASEGICETLRLDIDSVDEEIITRQGVDYYIVNSMERKLLCVAYESVPQAGDSIEAVLLGNTIITFA